MTVFLYVDKGKSIKRMRCVMFQAKTQESTGDHVVDDPEQRKLYDDCHRFDYVHGTVSKKGDSRTFPKGASRKKALQFMFVEPRPVETRTIPSAKGAAQPQAYGDHLVRFLNGKTGLKSDTKRSGWGKIVWELMERTADTLCTDGKIKGPGIKDLLNHFNSLEKHDVWCIDEGQNDGGLGVQFVIVWDGDIPDEQTQVITLPKLPTHNVEVSATPAKDEEEELAEYLVEQQLEDSAVIVEES